MVLLVGSCGILLRFCCKVDSVFSHFMYATFQVQPKHVKEAFRLLNKSIIRVETPDIQFDEQETQGMSLRTTSQKYTLRAMYILSLYH